MKMKNEEIRHIIYKTKNIAIQYIGNRLIKKIENVLKTIGAQNKHGLDLGSGEGHLLQRLINSGRINDILALDFETKNIVKAQQLYPNISYLHGDAENIPLQDSLFDFILAIEILEHVKNPHNVLHEMLRVSKDDSHFIISVPNEPFFHIGALCTGRHVKKMGKNPRHLSFWTTQQFIGLLETYLTIERHYNIATFPWQLYLCKPIAGKSQ